jgi:Ser/Thr protein kinase RdoA (MazF antagonist)
MSPEQLAAQAFALEGRIVDIRPLGRGLINDSFIVATDASPPQRAVLQRINRRAFPQPELIMENLRALSAHAARRTMSDPRCRELRLPWIVRTRNGKDYFVDAEGGFWRALSYIENSRTLDALRDKREAGEVGFALGRFHALTHDLDPARLHVTRPHFHETPHYLARYLEVAAGQARSPLPPLPNPSPTRGEGFNAERYCRDFIEARKESVNVLEDAKRRGEIALRVIHGDPKLDNILFDATSGEAVSLIDLDTVQPGLRHYDLGDCLRSCCNPAGESPKDPGEARFDLDIARAILARYFTETRGLHSEAELRLLPEAIRLIPFELGIRFFTDHLEGNRYFKVQWPGHNLLRATTQFRLVEDIERCEPNIRSMITELAGVSCRVG